MPKKKDDVVEAKRGVKHAYRLWLNNKVNSAGNPLTAYSQIMAFLFRAPFEPGYPGDDNRIGDIRELRSEFANSMHLENVDYIEIQQMEPSVLELMISMAVRINNYMSTEDDIPKYFKDMMESLGVLSMDDSNFNFSDASKKIDIFNERTYQKNGKGGLFWVKKLNDNGYDATKLDLWTQSQAYLNSIS